MMGDGRWMTRRLSYHTSTNTGGRFGRWVRRNASLATISSARRAAIELHNSVAFASKVCVLSPAVPATEATSIGRDGGGAGGLAHAHGCIAPETRGRQCNTPPPRNNCCMTK